MGKLKMINFDKLLDHKFYINDTQVRFEIDEYWDGKRAKISLICCGEDDFQEPYATLTVNIPEVKLEENEILVKTWSENMDIAIAAFKTGLFEDTGKTVPTGFTHAEIWRVK